MAEGGRVIYNSKRLIPAPLVNINKRYERASDGKKIGSTYDVTLNGTIVAFKGSPDSSGSFWVLGGYPNDSRSEPTFIEDVGATSRLKAIIQKQEAIREIFSEDGHTLEIQSADGTAPMKMNPRILDINFAEGQWYDRCSYTISCETDIIYVDGSAVGEDEFDDFINSATENWTIETVEDTPENLDIPRTYRLTHTVSAQGKLFYDENGQLQKEPWKHAQSYVQSKLGFDSVIALSSGVSNLPDYYGGFNHTRTENLDEIGGSYSVTENWLLTSGTALEDFTVQRLESSDDGIKRVSIEGNIQGLEQRDANLDIQTSGTKYDNAKAKFEQVQPLLISRAQDFSSITSLNAIPENKTVGRNPVAGTINYSFQYNDKPSITISGAISEVVSIQNSVGVDIFASVGVLGRSVGELLQDLNTQRAATRNLSLEVVFTGVFFNGDYNEAFNTNNPRLKEPTKTQIQSIIDAAHPVTGEIPNNLGNPATQAFVSDWNENWNPMPNPRYSLNISYVYE